LETARVYDMNTKREDEKETECKVKNIRGKRTVLKSIKRKLKESK